MNNSDMPAMPSKDLFLDGEQHPVKCRGLTKREHFAGLAMQGLLGSDPDSVWLSKEMAKSAVSMADALLAALEDRT